MESNLVKSKLEEFFWEWLSLPESQKLIRQSVQVAKGESLKLEDGFPSPHFGVRGSPSRGPSPPGSPSRSLHHQQKVPFALDGAAFDGHGASASTSPTSPVSPTAQAGLPQAASLDVRKQVETSRFERPLPAPAKIEFEKPKASDLDTDKHRAESSKVIPRFWWPKRFQPVQVLPADVREKIHDCFTKQNITEIRTYQHLEPIVTDVFGLSKYFVVPIFHKVKVFCDIVKASTRLNQALLAPSTVPITEHMLVDWCNGKIQLDDPVLSFFHVVKSEHNAWIEREDFNIFLMAILLTHPGLDFLRDTQEFQDRYSDTVISRIFFVYDRKDIGRIYLSDLRRYKPSVIETWKQLAAHDDIKMVRDYFSYEHFYVIYCTFWELDSDHDFLLDKDDLLKYDGHALSRRAIDRIFSEIPTKFTSAVPGRMGYEDFIRFLLCDQDRSTDRSVEYWFQLFDLDGDGVIRCQDMNYFYEEQVQRMECLNYETISFADIMCQMNDMIFPKLEGQFRLNDFKRRRKFAGTFFSLFSSLNKFLTFEHRDPFLAKQEQLYNPSFSDWDRWCADEYLRLAMEDGSLEGEDQEEDNTRSNDCFIDEADTRGRRTGGHDISL